MNANIIAALTALSLSASVFAADDQTSAKPQSGSATTEQESPSHPAAGTSSGSDDKVGGATSTAPNHPAAKNSDLTVQTPSNTGASGVRDWSAIDIDRDNSISPDEMKTFLEKVWADTKKSG